MLDSNFATFANRERKNDINTRAQQIAKKYQICPLIIFYLYQIQRHDSLGLKAHNNDKTKPH